ncbi:hypothetical protein Leryth_018128 [Lithospermum erythrorhizon]|nr:hypothetical protein Leryth_018128 [Lithospermum erythrorhizon]
MRTPKRRQINGTSRLFFGGNFLVGLLFSRRGGGGGGRISHFFPVLAGMLLLFAFMSYLSPPITHRGRLSHDSSSSSNAANRKLKEEKENEFRVPRGSGSSRHELWSTNNSQFFYGCSNSSKKILNAEVRTHPSRYLLIATSGGLNQQRTGIVDAVVAAYMLNATLVIPKLDQKSYWKDASNFSEIFDVDWFISSLEKDVTIIKELPATGGKTLTPYSTRVPRKCNEQCYQDRVLPLLKKKHAVQLTKFDYRLSNYLDSHLQKLRCRVNYHGLKFTDSINEMGRELVGRMRMKNKNFVALHLRFEPDMLAFSGCKYDFGEKEIKKIATIRRRWKGLKANPEKQRRQGRCPLTPEEVGLMLRALGYGDDVHIYVASGEIFGGEETMAQLKALFPNVHTKETIASKEALAPFLPYSSRMAALDYIVCDYSDVFVTNNNGNMAKILAGRRRYFGHKPTIRPNAKKLYKVFMNRENMTWGEFSSHIKTHQMGFMGEANEMKPGKGVFHENPEACICEASASKAEGKSPTQRNVIIEQYVEGGDDGRRDLNEVSDEQLSEYDKDVFNLEYMWNENTVERGESPTKMATNTSPVEQPEQPEFEGIFSD